MKPETLAEVWYLIDYLVASRGYGTDTRKAINAILSRHVEQPAETLAALRNMGHDVTCGACMEVAFTGVTLAAHTCGTVEQPAETEEQAAIRAALTNLLVACGKVPVARFNIGGFACPHCGAKADEKCRSRCWYPALEAAIDDGREALRLAKETDHAD
jgi:predicted RNA-binding Zn-ribbon protein involved in translation (DUF1610 family)